MWFKLLEGDGNTMSARLENTPYVQTGFKNGEIYMIHRVERDGMSWWEPVDQSLRVAPDWDKLAAIFNKGDEP